MLLAKDATAMQMIKGPLSSGRIQPAREEVSELTFPEMGHQGASISRRLRSSGCGRGISGYLS
jgi:hypothetical protein